MCGGKNTSTTTQTAPNSTAMSAYQNVLGQAQNVAQTPFNPYGGEFTAPINAQQNLGISNINQNAGFAGNPVNQALQLEQNAANPLTAQQIQNYQNPYTQQVVNATEAQFNNQNAQQQQQVLGNAAQQGALGGDRTGVAQANLAGQQQMAQAPVIAGLYNQGYNQALQTAQQQYQQNPMQAAFGLTSTGVGGQNAALQGAGAQFGVGTSQQQTQQQQDQALYNQYLMQQAYPFQTTQWLAGLSTGVGSQMGGTSQTTPPAPNPWTQYGGLALAALGLGAPTAPKAYSGGGVRGYAPGGTVGSMGGSPYGGISGYVPTIGITAGVGAPAPPKVPTQTGTPPTAAQASAGLSGIQKLLGGVGGGNPISLAPPGISSQSSPYSLGSEGGTSGFLGGLYSDGGRAYPKRLQTGGTPGAFIPSFDDRFGPADPYPSWLHDTANFGVGTSAQHEPAADFSLDEKETAGLGLGQKVDWSPEQDAAVAAYAPEAQGVVASNVPTPRSRPSEADDSQQPAGLVAPQTLQASGEGREGAPSGGGEGGFLSKIFPGTGQPGQGKGLFGLGLLSPDAKMALMRMGIGMAGSTTPYAGVNIARGAEQALTGYQGDVQQQAGLRKTEADIEHRRKQLEQQAEQFQKNLELKTREFEQPSAYQRQHLALEERKQKMLELQPTVVTDPVTGMPHPMVRDPDTGQMLPIDPHTGQLIRPNPLLPQQQQQAPQAPVNPLLQQQGQARTVPVAWNVDPGMEYLVQPAADEIPKTANPQVLEGIDAGLAARVRALDEGRMPLPTGAAQRMPQNIAAMELLSRYDPGFTAQDYQSKLATRRDFTAGPTAKNITALNTVVQHIKEADDAAGALNNWHSGFGAQPLNAAWLATREFQQDPRVTRFGNAANAVANELEKAFRGNTTAISGIQEWRKGLNAGMSPEQWKASRDSMLKLLGGRLESLSDQYNRGMGSAKQPMDMLSPRAREILGTLDKPQQQQATPQQSQQRQVGQEVTTPKGRFRWNGQGWDPVQ